MDNFSKLAIEDCLISKLPDLFSPEVVAALDEDVINEIAMETESAAWERDQTNTRLELCHSALGNLKLIESMRAPGNERQNATEKHKRLTHFVALRIHDVQGLPPSSDSESNDVRRSSDGQVDVSLSKMDWGLSDREDERSLTNGVVEDFSNQPKMRRKQKRTVLQDDDWVRS